MQVELLHKEKNTWVLGIPDEGHTFLNILRSTLNKNKSVEGAAYRIDHPLVGLPELIVETKKKSPKDAFAGAAKELLTTAGDFRSAFEKGLRQ